MSTNEVTKRWEDCVDLVQADLRVDASKLLTTSSSSYERRVHDEPTVNERHRMLENGGSLDFWNDPAEDIYTMDDGEPA
jgi:hypothetical protein